MRINQFLIVSTLSWVPSSSITHRLQQVDSPHTSAVQDLVFQPAPSSPLLLSVGTDCRAKLWSSSSSSWTCCSSLQLRDLPSTTGAWSSDGTVLGLGFGHLVTLWDTESRLRSTLGAGAKEEVVTMAFGRGEVARMLFSATSSKVTAWDLLTLRPVWGLSLEASPHTRLLPCPTSPLMAILQKDVLLLLSSTTGSTVHRLEGTNSTGGGAWLPDSRAKAGSSLHFLTFSGQLQRLGGPPPPVSETPLASHSPGTLGAALATKGGVAARAQETRQWTRARQEQDLEALLCLPLHALPPPSQLRASLVKARLVALPRLRPVASKSGVVGGGREEAGKQVDRINNAFKFEEEPAKEMNLKEFCKLLKTTNLATE